MTDEAIQTQLKKEFTTNDLAAVHSQYKTAKKNDPALNKEYEEAEGKKARGSLALGWYLSKESGGRFQTSAASLRTDTAAEKKEHWTPEAEMQVRYGKDFDLHVASGRITWRECPDTPGVWEYMDTKDVTVLKSLAKGKQWSQQTDKEAGDEAIQNFDDAFDCFMSGQASAGLFLDLGEGLWRQNEPAGKGVKAIGAGKGKGKGGKGTLPGTPLALEDLSEEDQVLECMSKSKRMLTVLQQTITNAEELSCSAKQCKYYTKTMDADIKGIQESLGKAMKKVKGFVVNSTSKIFTSNFMKTVLLEAANEVKEAAATIKDLKQIMAKGGDAASVKSKAVATIKAKKK